MTCVWIITLTDKEVENYMGGGNETGLIGYQQLGGRIKQICFDGSGIRKTTTNIILRLLKTESSSGAYAWTVINKGITDKSRVLSYCGYSRFNGDGSTYALLRLTKSPNSNASPTIVSRALSNIDFIML